MNGHCDDRLMADLAGGDRRALEELYLRHAELVLNTLYPLLGRRGLAEDVLQDTFLSLLEISAAYRPGDRFLRFIQRVAVNRALMLLRRERRARPWGDREPPADPPEPDAGEAVAAVQAALAELPPKLRAAVVLKKIRGFTYEDAAAILDVPAGTVQTRVFHGVRRLKKILIRKGGHESLC